MSKPRTLIFNNVREKKIHNGRYTEHYTHPFGDYLIRIKDTYAFHAFFKYIHTSHASNKIFIWLFF